MTGQVSSMAGRRVARAGERAATAQHVRERRVIFLLVPVAMLLIVGLGAMLSASSVVSIRESPTADQFFLFKRQLLWVGIGLAAFVITMRIPYRVWARFALPMFVGVVVLLVATVIIGDSRNGAARWIAVGPITIQAGELAKLATVTLLAAALTKKERWLEDLRHFAYPVAAILGGMGILLMLQPDFGTLLIIIGAAFAVMAVSAAPFRYVIGLAVLGAGMMTALAFSAPYRLRRLVGFLDPFADPLGNGHQAVQSLVALGTGGLFGIGLGASRARWSFLPNAHTDFIFAIIGEETGFVGASLIIVLFAALGVVGIRVALQAPDRFGRLMATGIVAWFTIQALVNIGGVIAVLPITGVPLPFVSAGGSAMLMNLAAVGVLVNIARSPLGAAGPDLR